MIAGLTGGIGSGKSTVARMFEILGCGVFNSDLAAKQCYFDEEIKQKIIKLLGKEAYLNQNTLNKPYISKQIFSDTGLLHKTNSIIHPAVKKRFIDFIAQNPGKLILKETALLFEAHLENQVDKIIMVSSPDELRIDRVMRRDGSEREDVIKKIKSQLSQQMKIKQSHYVIVNDEKKSLIEQVLSIYSELQTFSTK